MRKIAFFLSLFLIFVIPFENLVTTDSLGTLTKLIGIVVTGFWMVTIITTAKIRRPHPFHLSLFLFILWNVITIYWTVDLDRTISQIITYFQLVVLTYILWDLYVTPTALKLGLQAYVLGAYVSIGSIMINYMAAIQRNYNRYGATGFNVNDVSLILALGIPIAWQLGISADFGDKARIGILRVANFIYPSAAIFAILLTATRGALIAAMPGLLFIFLTFNRLRLFIRILIFIALIYGLFVIQDSVPQEAFQRIGTIGSSIASSDLNGRVEIWHQGFEVLSLRPILGVGSNAFRSAIDKNLAAHNTFLSIAVEGGVIGLILFTVLLIIIVHQAVAHQSRWVSIFWLNLLLIWGMGVSTLTWEYRKPTWLVFSFVIIGANLLIQPEMTQPYETIENGDNVQTKII